ncbi:SGNH/GDSL hydrolase family protein [Kribbella sp. NPDC059898]|uniref:SGNH/GDSL hydrolase family protein n=1 Tax=Kribbella sp. NPDC059898 TaxID=3346995 RepID=UPI0036478BEE
MITTLSVTAESGVRPTFGRLDCLAAANQTIRNVVYPTVGGTSVRVRLTNRYGTRPVTFDQVTVGQPNGAKTPVTFGGGTSVTLAAGVDVVTAPHVGTSVALGDSITDGTGTADNSNTRWSDALFARIAAGQPGQLQAVTNSGIGGNEVTLDRQPPYFGVSAQHRLDADVLDQPGVSLVLVAEGINDLTASNIPADEVIGGLRDLVDRTHAAGLKIVGLTITPCGGYGVCGAGPLAQRAIVNSWIRTSGAFDAVVDFDAVVRDPANPDHLLAAYDSGDHLHPNAAAYQQLADAMDLRQLDRLVDRHPR